MQKRHQKCEGGCKKDASNGREGAEGIRDHTITIFNSGHHRVSSGVTFSVEKTPTYMERAAQCLLLYNMWPCIALHFVSRC